MYKRLNNIINYENASAIEIKHKNPHDSSGSSSNALFYTN